MGMYDDVIYNTKCPKCGALVTEWQSKDGLCLMEKLTPADVTNFYTSCGNCKSWLTAKTIVTDYVVRISIPDEMPIIKMVKSNGQNFID